MVSWTVKCTLTMRCTRRTCSRQGRHTAARRAQKPLREFAQHEYMSFPLPALARGCLWLSLLDASPLVVLVW